MNGNTHPKLASCIRSAQTLRMPTWAAYGVYISGLVVIVLLAGVGLLHRGETRALNTAAIADRPALSVSPISKPLAPAQRTMLVRGSMISTNDDWATQLRDPAYWAARRGEKSKATEQYQRSGLTRTDPAPVFSGTSSLSRGRSKSGDSGGSESSQSANGEKTFRTVCVRLCDGYFWPISFSTTEENFDRDQATCERTCDGPVKLYTYRNPGSELEEMEDRKGQSYKRLPTAFQFRTKFEPACKCKPHPWEQEAKDRHQLYALEVQRSKLSKQAAVDVTPAIKELKTKVVEATLASKAAAKAAQADLDADAASKQRATRRSVSASKGGRDRSGLETASVEQSKSSLPASDGVVIMRLGSRPAVAVKTEPTSKRRASREPPAE